MKSETYRTFRPMIWTAAISLTLFCATAVAAITGWIPDALGHSGESAGPARVEWSRLDAARPVKAATANSPTVEPQYVVSRPLFTDPAEPDLARLRRPDFEYCRPIAPSKFTKG